MLFADIENNANKRNHGSTAVNIYDTSEVIKKAIIHDLEESITGDILYPFKHNRERLKPQLKEAITECVDNELFRELSPDIREYYIRLWKNSKDKTPEGVLVSAMDKFEIMMFAISEIDIGNTSFSVIYRNARNILQQKYSHIISLKEVIEKIESIYG